MIAITEQRLKWFIKKGSDVIVRMWWGGGGRPHHLEIKEYK